MYNINTQVAASLTITSQVIIYFCHTTIYDIILENLMHLMISTHARLHSQKSTFQVRQYLPNEPNVILQDIHADTPIL